MPSHQKPLTPHNQIRYYGSYKLYADFEMKTSLLLAFLAALVYYHRDPVKPVAKAHETHAAPSPIAPKQIVVAPAPSYADRWKSGPSAFTDLKTGPNAQVHFEPFLPDEQANWNPNPGYTIVSGARIQR
jgi:hypothetical protein